MRYVKYAGGDIDLSPDIFVNGDCLDLFSYIPDKSVDMVLSDPPYGSTPCKWDVPIPFKPMWDGLFRIIKDDGVIIMTASQPFSSMLVCSNIDMFQYDWIWEKPQGVNPTMAKRRPMKVHEQILVFYKEQPVYNPKMTISTPYGGFKSGNGKTSGETLGNAKSRHRDNPSGTRYPRSIQKFKNVRRGKIRVTQKPVDLFDYFIKTYTKEGDLVLDFATGSGTTCVSALNTGRKCIAFEKDSECFDKAVVRVQNET